MNRSQMPRNRILFEHAKCRTSAVTRRRVTDTTNHHETFYSQPFQIEPSPPVASRYCYKARLHGLCKAISRTKRCLKCIIFLIFLYLSFASDRSTPPSFTKRAPSDLGAPVSQDTPLASHLTLPTSISGHALKSCPRN